MKCSATHCPASASAEEIPFCRRHWNCVPRVLQRRIIAGLLKRSLAAATAACDIKGGWLPYEKGYRALLALGFDRARLAQGIVAIR